MATRSLIGMQHDDKCVEYIYCHWDGYPQHNGRVLLNYYSSSHKVGHLMSLGGIPSLEENIEKIQHYGDDSLEVDSEEEFQKEDHGSEYKYLFKGGKWYMCTGKGPFHELTMEHCK